MLRRESNGITTYHFENLAGEHLAHAVFTRVGGVSRTPFATLNVGRSVGDEIEAVVENHARIYAYLGLSSDQVVTAHQAHGNRVATVTASQGAMILPGTDGLTTASAGIALLLRFADCQPILLYDPAHHSLCLVHAGWRGIAQGIAHRAVETMQEAYGSQPKDLIAGLGPAIGVCCYTVGDNVAAAMGYALPHWNRALHRKGDEWRLDLSQANTQQLQAAGVKKIERSRICTACHTDEFYSHRAEGERTGRFAVVAFLQPKHTDRSVTTDTPSSSGSEMGEPEEVGTLTPPGFPAFGEFAGKHP